VTVTRSCQKGDASGVDALILDLEDLVAPSRKVVARNMMRDYLMTRPAGARSHWLLAAKASGVAAIETLYADFRDDKGLWGVRSWNALTD
jgi:citrate lyase beta subunit